MKRRVMPEATPPEKAEQARGFYDKLEIKKAEDTGFMREDKRGTP
jgi:hypothetical protein